MEEKQEYLMKADIAKQRKKEANESDIAGLESALAIRKQTEGLLKKHDAGRCVLSQQHFTETDLEVIGQTMQAPQFTPAACEASFDRYRQYPAEPPDVVKGRLQAVHNAACPKKGQPFPQTCCSSFANV